MSWFTFENISVSYDRVEALHDVSIDVENGEIVALIGANGAGKSTVLRAITGLAKTKSGRIAFDGQPITGMRTEEIIRRGIAMVPEGRRIWPHVSVKDHLLIGAHNRRGRGEIDADLEHMCVLFPRLKERWKQAAGSLSGGEQQMVSISRALMSRPRLLLLDEPSLGLAPMMIRQIAQAVTTINRESGMGVILVEQNSRMALKISNRAYVLETGSVALSGKSAELLNDDQVRRLYLGG